MKVAEAMAHTISTASPQDSLQRVAQLMKQEDAGFIPVCEGDNILGVITDRDIVIRCLAERENLSGLKAEDCMTRNAATVDADADIAQAAQIMQQREIRRLPVTRNGKIAGVLSHGNLVQAAQSEGPADMATLGVTRGA
jgi:predicted transcriptional regulator